MHPSLTHLAGRTRLAVRRLLRRAGVDVVRYASGKEAARLMSVFGRLGVDLVLDVGANRGQYAIALRREGYRGNIASFEPGIEAFRQLAMAARDDARWSTHNVAVGDRSATVTLHVSADSTSSSVLTAAELLTASAPGTRAIERHSVQQHRLDDLAYARVERSQGVFLKIDAQGYEHQVLKGSPEILRRALGLQVEMSLAQLYKDQHTYLDVLTWLGERGFSLFDILPGFSDTRTGRLLQFDGLLVRSEML
ncbi:MAG: FkbM family methyltransferase [Myxococcales bacterium]|nr:FkbM family methyltransferase [Myxococcales bacterium]